MFFRFGTGKCEVTGECYENANVNVHAEDTTGFGGVPVG